MFWFFVLPNENMNGERQVLLNTPLVPAPPYFPNSDISYSGILLPNSLFFEVSTSCSTYTSVSGNSFPVCIHRNPLHPRQSGTICDPSCLSLSRSQLALNFRFRFDFASCSRLPSPPYYSLFIHSLSKCVPRKPQLSLYHPGSLTMGLDVYLCWVLMPAIRVISLLRFAVPDAASNSNRCLINGY